MHKPLQEAVLPETVLGDTATVSELFDQMGAEELPAFVAHEAGFSMKAVLQRLQPVLDERGYKSEKKPKYLRKEEAQIDVFPDGIPLDSNVAPDSNTRYDLGFHADNRPSDSVLTLTLHLTTRGAAAVRFLEPTAAYFASLQGISRTLGPEAEDLVEAGFVNDEFMRPTLYRTATAAGSLVLFRIGGATPLMHDFVTTQWPRSAQTRDIELIRH